MCLSSGPLIPGRVKLVSDDLTLIPPLYPNCLSSALPILHGGVIVKMHFIWANEKRIRSNPIYNVG